MTWTVSVEPARDARDAWLTISTDLGRHYLVHLIPVSEDNQKGEHLVGFYYFHEPPRMRIFRQARAAGHPRQIATGHR